MTLLLRDRDHSFVLARNRCCASPISGSDTIRLRAGLAILCAMRRIVHVIAAIRFAWSTRRDSAQALALRHQVFGSELFTDCSRPRLNEQTSKPLPARDRTGPKSHD